MRLRPARHQNKPKPGKPRLQALSRKGNIRKNQNLAVWFCARHGPTPFFAFGTPAPFRGTRAASRDHCTTGAFLRFRNHVFCRLVSHSRRRTRQAQAQEAMAHAAMEITGGGSGTSEQNSSRRSGCRCAGGSPPVAAQHQVRKEHGPRNTRLRSGLYIDNAQGAPRRDEQNPLGGDPTRDYVLSSDERTTPEGGTPPAVSTSGLSLLPLPSVA